MWSEAFWQFVADYADEYNHIQFLEWYLPEEVENAAS